MATFETYICVKYTKGKPTRIYCGGVDFDGDYSVPFRKSKYAYTAKGPNFCFCHDQTNTLVLFINDAKVVYRTNKVTTGKTTVELESSEIKQKKIDLPLNENTTLTMESTKEELSKFAEESEKIKEEQIEKFNKAADNYSLQFNTDKSKGWTNYITSIAYEVVSEDLSDEMMERFEEDPFEIHTYIRESLEYMREKYKQTFIDYGIRNINVYEIIASLIEN